MIEIKRDDKTLVCEVDPGVDTDEGGEWCLDFTATCTDALTAELLLRQLRKHLRDTVQAIRAQVYEKAHADGRNHRRKCTAFSGYLGTTESATAGCRTRA